MASLSQHQLENDVRQGVRDCWLIGHSLEDVLTATDDPEWRRVIANEYVALQFAMAVKERNFNEELKGH